MHTNFFCTWISCSRVWRPFRDTESEGASWILCSFLASWACRVLLQLSYLKIWSVRQRVQHWIWWPPNSFDQYNALYVGLSQIRLCYLSKASFLVTSSSTDGCFSTSFISTFTGFIVTWMTWKRIKAFYLLVQNSELMTGWLKWTVGHIFAGINAEQFWVKNCFPCWKKRVYRSSDCWLKSKEHTVFQW